MKQKILNSFRKVGIRHVGFCAFAEVSGRLLPCRAAERLPENAQTVILCALPYRVRDERPKNISRYAAVPDYHRVLLPMLEQAAEDLRRQFPGFCFAPFADNSPIPEVYAAAVAGLGKYGKNGLLITEKYGSWVFLGEIVTDLAVECENRFSTCLECGACAAACPKNETGECLSAVSQQKKPLTEDQAAALKKNGIVWGCDRCAEVCPLNRETEKTDVRAFSDGYRDEYTPGEPIGFRAYEWRGEKVVRRNYENLIEK